MILPPYIPIGCSPVWLGDHKQLTLSAVRGHAAGHGSYPTIIRLRWSCGGGAIWSPHTVVGGYSWSSLRQQRAQKLILVLSPPTGFLELYLDPVSSKKLLGG